MTLYRAIYQRPAPDSRLRGMTFAAHDAEQASAIAHDWQINDALLTVRAVRPMQANLELTP